MSSIISRHKRERKLDSVGESYDSGDERKSFEEEEEGVYRLGIRLGSEQLLRCPIRSDLSLYKAHFSACLIILNRGC